MLLVRTQKEMRNVLQAYLRDIAGSVSDHHDKVSIEIKQVK